MAISFDGANKQINLSTGTTTLSVLDLWSRWVDWFLTDDNSKYGIWFLQVGGNDINTVAGTSIPIYIFQDADVVIKPQEADHTLAVTDGILVLIGGGDPFKDTDGAYTVRINYQQPVQVIGMSTEGGSSISAADIWEHIVENGLTAEEVLRVLIAVAAGKTTITDLGGGLATVKFRDLADTKDRVEADMDGSERTSVIIDED